MSREFVLPRAIMLAPFIAAAGLIAFAPTEDNPTVCPFALCTGTACPGCGLTRAAGSLIRGDVSGALVYHPLIPLVLLQVVGAWIWFVLHRQNKVSAPSPRVVSLVLTANLFALVAVWGLRLAAGTLPPV